MFDLLQGSYNGIEQMMIHFKDKCYLWSEELNHIAFQVQMYSTYIKYLTI